MAGLSIAIVVLLLAWLLTAAIIKLQGILLVAETEKALTDYANR